MNRPQKGVKILCRTRGLAQDLVVTRKGETLTLWSEAGIRHTVYDTTAPHIPGLEYARNIVAALAFCPHAESCLILGLGGGSTSRMLLKARPRIRVDAVEMDPAVVKLAARYFGIDSLPRFRVHLEDAAVFLRRCTAKYGMIVVDTYLGEQLPGQCLTREFFENARRCLLSGGVLVVNWLEENAKKTGVPLKMIESCVGPVWRLPCLKSSNVLYFAVARKITRSAIVSTARKIRSEIPFENSLNRIVQRLQT
jgi:spermidine synthase